MLASWAKASCAAAEFFVWRRDEAGKGLAAGEVFRGKIGIISILDLAVATHASDVTFTQKGGAGLRAARGTLGPRRIWQGTSIGPVFASSTGGMVSFAAGGPC